VKTLDAGMRADVSKAVSDCESLNDYTSECVIRNGVSNLNVAPELSPFVSKLLSNKVPDRMSALGKKMDQTKTSTWLPACLQAASKIEIYEQQKAVVYSSADPKVKNAYIGNYLFYNYESDDTNKTCAQGVIASLQKEGIKTPESGVTINVLQKPFLDEFKSFESEVLNQMKTAVKGCFMSGCKDDRVFELLTQWEQKNPQKRTGISTKEFAVELRGKVKSW
jgi:hypothetical protein